MPDDKEIRDLYQRMLEGWNRGSAGAFAEPLAEDVDFVPFDGVRMKGRAEVIAFHGPLFATHLKGTRLVGRVESVRFLTDSIAVAQALGSTIMRGAERPSRARDSVQTLVAALSEGGWKVVAFQNTRVRPIGQSVLGTLHWLIGDWLWRFVPAPRRRYVSADANARPSALVAA